MRVSRAQAAENRKTVIDTACRLFSEHGFDGIGLKDLMHEAGLTQGAFYKQFESKEDLIALATGRALEKAKDRWASIVGGAPQDPLRAIISAYLSPDHRDDRMDGCPVGALGGDIARKGPEVKAPFEAGIRAHLAQLGSFAGTEANDPRAMTLLATMVGALVLSRSVNDRALADSLLAAAKASLLGAATPQEGTVL
jgi:TetR/AcrR family transcriptional repressor of nem operon